jgi:hypothetical protein
MQQRGLGSRSSTTGSSLLFFSFLSLTQLPYPYNTSSFPSSNLFIMGGRRSWRWWKWASRLDILKSPLTSLWVSLPIMCLEAFPLILIFLALFVLGVARTLHCSPSPFPLFALKKKIIYNPSLLFLRL